MEHRTAVVCLPSEDLAARVRSRLDPSAPAELTVWDTTAPPPPSADRVTVFVPPYPASAPPDPPVLAALPSLAVVQLLSAGFDGWDGRLPAGVVLCNAAGVHGVSTAELAVALVLASSRDLPGRLQDQATRTWRRTPQIGLTERPVLILGAGDIGRRVATALAALGAPVTLVGRTARDGVRAMTELRDLLPTHRVVVVALPLTEDTHGLIGRAELAALPDGAIVVNVARGPIVETGALLSELTAGRLGAGLDVTDPEPLPADHPLWSAPNLILTPHIGGGVRDWPDRAARLIVDQLARIAAGGGPAHVVMRGDPAD